ncbi:MAG TPA: PQQ-binding-like beta-propeller repeat protein [Bryobacteraceae bacterium]|nr:PQQ-binding-like beta-propeller repeat protein [Bryobacteraceae bacterium]
MVRLLIALCAALLISWSTGRAQTPSGEAIYKQRCSACHDQAGSRIPPRQALQKMPALRILRAMNAGAMMTVAYPLRREEREAVATYLGTPGPEPGPQPEAFCKERAISLKPVPDYSWNGWSPRPDNARFQSADLARLSISQVRKLKLKWAFGLDGDISSYAQPTVVDGNVFMGSGAGMIYALRAATGCIEWTYQAGAPVREAVATGPIGDRRAVLFGDLTGMFYALDAQTGHLLWKKRIEDHEAALLTGSPTVYNGNVYVGVASWEETRAINPAYPCCSFRGSVVALRVRDGAQVWKTYTIHDAPHPTGKTSAGTLRQGPSGAGVWSAPTVDPQRRILYVTTGDNYSAPATTTSDAVLALDLATGHMLWSRQVTPGDVYNSGCGAGVNGPNCPEEGTKGPDYDFGSSAILVKMPQGGDLLIAGQKSGMVYALDPGRKGEIVWSERVGKGGTIGGVQWGMASDGQNVYAAASDAFFFTKDQVRILAPDQGGGLTALRVANGAKAWHAAPQPCGSRAGCSPAQSAALSAIPGIVFSGSMDGHMRAFAAEDGQIIWDFDTRRDFATVNGVAAKGGAIDGPGPVIVNGMLFMNSGYGRFGGSPGNVVLAFAPEE